MMSEELTSGSMLLSSLILLPLRFRYARLGHVSASASRFPVMVLSLTSSYTHTHTAINGI